MKLNIKGLPFVLLGIFLLSPLAAQLQGNSPLQKSGELMQVQPTNGTSTAEISNDLTIFREIPGQLSDFWKYTIAISVMVFFLGVALFVQLRGERNQK